MKRKQFLKGINEISEEGAIQVFKEPNIGVENLTVGVIGMLQFDVLQYRMKSEYGVDITLQTLPYVFARWVNEHKITKEMLGYIDSVTLVEDKYQRPVILFRDEWSINKIQEKLKDIKLLEIAPNVAV
jgi:peptide chain release factor 3